MRTVSGRARGRRGLRLEFLEDRKLLSVAGPQGITAEVARLRPTTITSFSGQIHGGPATAGLYIPTLPGYHSSSGGGPTSQPRLGEALFSSQDVENINGSTLTITNGKAQLTTYLGGANLYINYGGTGTIARRGATSISLTGTVISGTKQFLNETGTFTASGTVNPVNGRLHLRYTINLNAPAYV